MENSGKNEKKITRRILRVIVPNKIILFGSRARGNAKPNSDWDILVIADSELPRYRRASSLYAACSDLRQPIDIIVYTPEEINEWSGVSNAFVTTAIREGKVLYENKESNKKPQRPGGRVVAQRRQRFDKRSVMP